jgi:hypothetical protein
MPAVAAYRGRYRPYVRYEVALIGDTIKETAYIGAVSSKAILYRAIVKNTVSANKVI